MNELRKYIRSIIMEQVDDSPIGAIYCDMDGVLVDFERGAVELINAELEKAQDSTWSSPAKSIRSSVRRVHKDLGPDYRVTLGDDLRANKGIKNLSYAVVGRDPGTFFRNLQPLPDGISQLWPFLNALGVPVHILSDPINGSGEGGTAADGKRDWVKILEPAPSTVEIQAAIDKPNFAIDPITGKPNVLVDDKAATVVEWISRGGIGILHEPGNSSGSIINLQKQLAQLQ